MCWLNIKTEYTFKAVYGHLEQIANKCKESANYGGIADIGNTFGHIRWNKACKKVGIKPIYGVKLPVFEDPSLKERRIHHNYMTFIAKTQHGLQLIYRLVELAHDQFYYITRISYDQINDLPEKDVAIFSGVSPIWSLIKRSIYQEIGPHIPRSQGEEGVNLISCIDNYYVNWDDKKIYEPFVESRLMENKTYSLHIWSRKEWLVEFPNNLSAVSNMESLADICNVELPKANMVKYIGDDNIMDWCYKGAIERNIDIINDGKYKKRFIREIELIENKGYTDYFLVVGDLVRYAKTKMTVGPSRGCFLPGQKVMTFNGNSKNIESFKKGDQIRSSFGKKEFINDIFEYSIDEYILDIEFEDGTIISCTQDHKFLTINGWKKAINLTDDDIICDVRKNSNQISKLEQSGWDIIAAHRFLHMGYIDYDYLIKNKNKYPNGSKKEVKFHCEVCNNESFVQLRKLSKRIHNLAYRKICCNCINKKASNIKEAIENNRKVQFIAQNKPEQLLKNKNAQIKKHNKNWDNAKYDKLFYNHNYKKFIRYDHYENTCQLCEITGEDSHMELHHIDGNKNSKPKNLILLCISCHKTYHNNKRYNKKWIDQIKYMKYITSRKIYENKEYF